MCEDFKEERFKINTLLRTNNEERFNSSWGRKPIPKGIGFPGYLENLQTKGYKVWSPDLPNSDTPSLPDWLNTIFSNKKWTFNGESILVGHSSGATLILRILERLPKGVKVNKAILVAAPIELGTKEEYFGYKKGMISEPFNWDKIKNSCKNFYFIHSDNDKYECGIEQGKILHEHLGGELILKEGQGHFNLEVNENYKEFPFLLTLID